MNIIINQRCNRYKIPVLFKYEFFYTIEFTNYTLIVINK